MKTLVEVKSRAEAKLIKVGLADAQTRALVKVVGALMKLPSKQSMRRVMAFVEDHYREQDGNAGS